MQPIQTRAGEERGQAEEKSPSPPVRKRNLLLILPAAFLAVALVFGGALYAVAKLGFASALFSGLFGEQAAAEEIKEPAFTYAVPEILVNLPEGGRRFLSVKFYLGFDEPKLEEELDKRMPEIRDVVNKILWEKTVGEVGTPEGKENLREEIMVAINDMLHSGQLRGLYFWHVLVQ